MRTSSPLSKSFAHAPTARRSKVPSQTQLWPNRTENTASITHSDQDAVQVHGLPAALLPSASLQDLCQPVGVVDPQDVDVVLAAESLNEREVDLQGHVFNVVLVSGQDAQHHIVRVSVGEESVKARWRPANPAGDPSNTVCTHMLRDLAAS